MRVFYVVHVLLFLRKMYYVQLLINILDLYHYQSRSKNGTTPPK